MYRNYFFAFIYFDYEWKKLENFTKVGLRPIKLSYRQFSAVGGGLEIGDMTYEESVQEVEMFLWAETNQKMVLKRGQLKKLYPIAKKISENLGYELYLHDRIGATKS